MQLLWTCLLLLCTSPSCALVIQNAVSPNLLNREQIAALQHAYLLPTANLPEKTNRIPRILHQTTELDVKCIPNRNKDFTDGLEHRVMKDKEILAFLEQYFQPSVSATFQKLTGPHRADLFKYCMLYVQGGIYADVSVMPTQRFLDTFKENTTKYTWYTTATPMNKNSIKTSVFNGLMATPPRNTHMLRMIDFMVSHSPPRHYGQYSNADAFLISKDFLIGGGAVKEMMLKKHAAFEPGTYESEDARVVVLEQRCSWSYHYQSGSEKNGECRLVERPDHHGLCCNIYNSPKTRRLVAHPRDPDYPNSLEWKKCAARSFAAMSEEDAMHSLHIWNEVIGGQKEWELLI